MVDGDGGVDVEHGAADARGKTAGGHLLAGDRLAELLFAALRVAAAQRLDHNGSLLLLDDLVEGLDAVFLVVLHADDDLVHAEHLGEVAAAADDLGRALKHRAMVAGDVGLALGAVDDDRIDLADTAGDLRMGRERSAAHADDTGLFDHFDHFLNAQCVGVGGRLHFFAQLVLEIIVNDNGHDLTAHGVGAGLHRSDRTGNACVNGSAEALKFTDLLSKLDIVALGDRGSAGCAEVHRHGDDHLSGCLELLDGLFIGGSLHIVWMNAAKESLCHSLHLIFILPEQWKHCSIIGLIIQPFLSVVQKIFCRSSNFLHILSDFGLHSEQNRHIVRHFPFSSVSLRSLLFPGNLTHLWQNDKMKNDN